MPITESSMTPSDGLQRLLQDVAAGWYQPSDEAVSAARIADCPAVTFDADACRTWLTSGVAARHHIDSSFNPAALNIAAGLEALLEDLDDSPQPQVWQQHPALCQVRIWRTADGDGVDGGAIITADLDIGGERIRLGTLHQGFDDFTADFTAVGIDAAVQALGVVAQAINTEFDAYRNVSSVLAGYMVIGYGNTPPLPVAVLAAVPPALNGATAVIQRAGWWAVAVTTHDAAQAEQTAVAAIRALPTG